MKPNKYTREISSLLDGLGLTGEIMRSSKHIQVELTGPNGIKRVSTSATPSDHRTMLNFRSQLRRAAAEIGLETQ